MTVGVVGIAGAALASSGWIIMLLAGALWHAVGIGKPIGFGAAVIVSLALSVIGSFFRSK